IQTCVLMYVANINFCFADMTEHSGALCGGITGELVGENLQEALDLLEKSLASLASGDGPVFKVVKVNSVTSQVVAGTLYHLKVQLAQGDDIKDSYIQIWSRPWLQENGTNVTIKLEGDEKTIEKTF
ncbi:hypothetical protein KR222_010849, partial [Zaprionus bogoriensis]